MDLAPLSIQYTQFVYARYEHRAVFDRGFCFFQVFTQFPFETRFFWLWQVISPFCVMVAKVLFVFFFVIFGKRLEFHFFMLW